MFQQATADLGPLSGRLMPKTPMVFSIITATEKTRPDIIVLLNTLLELPAFVNCHVFSEADKRVVTAWQGFSFGPDSPLSDTTSPSETVALVQSSTGIINSDRMLNPQVCYWCRKTSLSCHLQLCVQCKSVVYCSRDCQVNDWKAFHKVECPQLKSGKTKKDVFMSSNRMDTLRMDGVQRVTYPFEIAPKDSNSVWRGDLMLLYLIGVGSDGIVGEKAKGFPTGWHIRPREITQYLRENGRS